MIYLGLGDKDHALQWLQKADEERAGEGVFLKVSSEYDSLRSDPRFADLRRRVGLTAPLSDHGGVC